jgi:exopolysaccharide biosynthesis polyprenyl glycosylphosphotransferase
LTKFGTSVPQENLVLFFDYFYLIIFFHLIFFTFTGMYRFRQLTSYVDILYRSLWVETFASITLTLTFLFIHTYYRPEINTSREVMFRFWFFALIFICLWRWAYQWFRVIRGKLINRILVVGKPEESTMLSKTLQAYSQMGHKVLGFIYPEKLKQIPNKPASETEPFPIVGDMDSLVTYAKENNVQDIILATHLPSGEILGIIDRCQQTGCSLWAFPSLYEVMIGRLQIQEIAGIPLIEINASPMDSWYGLVKRIMDILSAAIGCILAIPILLVVIPIIKLDSSGPIFYSQKRLGKDGKVFRLTKFRTMKQDAEKLTGAVLAKENDPRITRVGRFLRKTRLDEIPQLWNVLIGDMSLVGPRPERPELMEKFSVTSPHFHRRLAVRPGLTGLAQIQGRYDLDIESKLRYDMAYIHNVNFLLDLKILFATVKVVFTGKGAM